MQELIKNKYKKHKKTLHNLFWRSVQMAAKQGLAAVIFFLSAKLLEPYEFGVYSYILGFVYILVMLGDFGISSATSKFVAEYDAKDKEKLKYVLFNSMLLIFLATFFIAVITLIIGKIYLHERYVYLLYLLPVIFFSPLTSLYDGVYRGLKKFKELAFISITIGLISLFFVYFLISRYNLVGALLSQSLFYFVLFLALMAGYSNFSFKINKDIIKEIGGYSLVIGIGVIGMILYSRIDVIFLGHYGFIKEAGYYEIANKLLALLLIPFSILGQTSAPDITRYYAQKNYDEIRSKFKKYFAFSVIASFVLIGLVFISYDFMFSIFLDRYHTPEMFLILSLLLIVYFTEMINAVLSQGFVTPTGHVKIGTYLIILFGAIHILLNYFLMNIFGFIGIIYSIIITKVGKDMLYFGIYYSLLRRKK